jgi:hypothetical protein
MMPLIVAILLLLPVKLEPRHHLRLAFILWMAGGLVLALRGMGWLMESVGAMDPVMLGLAGAIAVAIGMAKGKFVLAKTSARNIERINGWQEPHKPIEVYGARSWMMIALMVGISLSLTYVFQLDVFWRGLVNLAIGFALIMSSLNYLKALAVQRASASS